MAQVPPASAVLRDNPVVAGAVRRRRRLLAALLAADLLLVIVLACVRVTAPAEGGAWLGFALGFEPLHLRSLVTAGAVLLVQLWFGGWVVRQALAGNHVVQVYPRDDSAGRPMNLAFSAPELVAMVLELAERAGIRRIARIFLVATPVPNAFTARVLGLGNVVALHANLFDFLPREGVRVVIAHELAHVRRSDSLVRQVTSAPVVLVMLACTLTLLQLLAGVAQANGVMMFLERALFSFLAFVVVMLIAGVLSALATAAARLAELIADAHAAVACGWEATANTLLLLGERTEALSVLMESFAALASRPGGHVATPTPSELERFLRRFPARELDHEVARRVAPKLFVQDRLELLRVHYHVPLAQEEIDRLAEHAAVAMAGAVGPEEQQRRAELEESLKRLGDWRHYDVDGSGHLDSAELAELVGRLREAPERMLFRQFLSPESRRADHPPVRERILFLADAFAGGEPAAPV